jgi:hypothetical protein
VSARFAIAWNRDSHQLRTRARRGPDEFEKLNIAIGSYTAEVQGQRLQRYLYKGGLPAVG